VHCWGASRRLGLRFLLANVASVRAVQLTFCPYVADYSRYCASARLSGPLSWATSWHVIGHTVVVRSVRWSPPSAPDSLTDHFLLSRSSLAGPLGGGDL